MRIRARLLLGMFGLMLAVPMVASAAPFGTDEWANAMAGGQPQPQPQPQPPPKPATHRHRTPFAWRHCVECQRAYVKAHDGVDIPPPPPIESGMVQGRVMASQMVAGPAGNCPTCQSGSVVTGPVMTANASAPGYAVVGGPGAMVSANAPGYAVVGETAPGFDPAPIGVSRSGQAPSGDPRMAAMGGPRPGAGPYDPSVVPTAVPPAQVALSGPDAGNPHIISHLFGLPSFGQWRRGQQDKERQKHAAIAYDQPGAKVLELPASMVYGKGDH